MAKETETVSVLIGNSDNKLTQSKWASFVNHIDDAISAFLDPVHFAGSPPSHSAWQNFCWVGEISSQKDLFLRFLQKAKEEFGQDSIAVVFGKTQFI